MRKFFIGFFLLFGSFFVLGKSLAAGSDIVINEIGAYENNSGYEWIEIYNKGDGDIDLGSWYFWQEGMQYGHAMTPTGTKDSVVSHGEYAVIVEDAEKFLSKYSSVAGSVFESSGWNDLVMNGKYIGLKDGYIKGDCATTSTVCIESFKYVSSTKYSLQRRDSFLLDYTSANWAEHASGNTVGAVNDFSVPVLPEQIIIALPETQTGGDSVQQIILESPAPDLTPVKINEFVSDPESGNEWVELYNTGSANLDLVGAMICDSRNSTSTCKKIVGTVGPNSWFVFDLGTRSFLNNGCDSVILKNSLGVVMDRIDYADDLAPDKGQSLARETDGVDTDSEDDWIVTNEITAGRANVIDEQDRSSNIAPKVSSSTVFSADESDFPAEIIISEILPNPKGDDSGEFIEIKNNSLVQANLSGWFFKNKEKKYIFPDDTIIFPGSFIVFYKTATKISIVNTMGKIELYNKVNEQMDLVKYENPPEGKSYALVNGEWEWTNPTPGKENESAVAEAVIAGKTSGAKVYKFVNSIEAARQASKGTWATVKGVVAVLPGVFGSQYFYLTNGTAGIQIYQNKKDFPELVVGDEAQISGTVSEANGIKRINIKSKNSVDILSVGRTVTNTELNLDEIDESLAGGLVNFAGEITEIKSNLMYMDNGAGEAVIYFKQGAKINKSRFQEGENARVTGILEQTKSGWQIWPRSNDDLESLGPSADLLKKQASGASGDATEKYLTATAGGITTLILAFLARARGLVMLGGIKKVVGLAGKFIRKG